MTNVVLALHLLVAVVLVGLVLMQRSEGGALGMGGGSGSLISGRGAANVLVRATGALAALFFITSISLTLLAQGGQTSRSVVDQPATPGFSFEQVLGWFNKPKPAPAPQPAPAPTPVPAPETPAPGAAIAPAPLDDLQRAGPLSPAPSVAAPAPAPAPTQRAAAPARSAAPTPRAEAPREVAIPIAPAAKPAESGESTLPAVQTPRARSGPDE